MTTPITPSIEEMEQMEKARTPGRWVAYEAIRTTTGEYEAFVQPEDASGEFEDIVARETSKQDAKFIAATSTFISSAIAVLREKDREIEGLRQEIGRLEAHMNPQDAMHAHTCTGCVDCTD